MVTHGRECGPESVQPQSPEFARGWWTECPRQAPDLGLVSPGGMTTPPPLSPKGCWEPLPDIFRAFPWLPLAEPQGENY